MKIALTGSGGFLGSRICSYYEGRTWEGKGGVQILPMRSREVVLSDRQQAAAFFEQERPDLLIHCGAISDTKTCQEQPEMSYEVNVQIPAVLAEVCAQYQVKMLFCSSDQVYFEDGGIFKMDYFHREAEAVRPKGIYGQQKLQAEQKILEACPDAVCLRLSWMYDWESHPEKEHGTLVSTVLENVLRGQSMSYPIYDYRSITNVWEVVQNLEKAASLPGGVYNFGSRNEGNTYEVVQELLKILKADPSLLQENREAFRDCPRNLRMGTGKLEQYGIHFRTTMEGLRRD